jgi:hypothetical protein
MSIPSHARTCISATTLPCKGELGGRSDRILSHCVADLALWVPLQTEYLYPYHPSPQLPRVYHGQDPTALGRSGHRGRHRRPHLLLRSNEDEVARIRHHLWCLALSHWIRQ